MKVHLLLEELAPLNKVALIMQQQLLELLDGIVDSIKLTKSPHNPKLYHEAIALHITGPLVEFYLDLSCDVTDTDYAYKQEWLLQYRTAKDKPGSGLVLLSADSIGGASGLAKVLGWFSGHRVLKALLNLNLTTDLISYNLLWFDKIARNKPDWSDLFIKTVVPFDAEELLMAQLIDKRRTPQLHYRLSLEGTPGNLRFKLGFNTKSSTNKTVHTIADITAVLTGKA